jgi:hypothetical protein
MTSINGNSLAELLLDNSNSLVDIIEQCNQDTNNESNEPPLLQNSPYYNTSDFQNMLDSKSDIFTIISLNCQSLNAKYDQLKYFIDVYNNESYKISAICLQETWLTADSDLSTFYIPGYHLISVGKSCSAHGGVAIYLHESFSFCSIQLESESNIWDGQFIQIEIENHLKESKTLILGNIYSPPRPSSDNINTFIVEIESIFNHFRNFKHVVIAGDYNIDLLKFKDNELINTFFDSLLSCSYIPKITLPTRLTQRKGTLIDNFFLKISDEFSSSTSGILLNDISDHLPYFVCLDYLQISKTTTKFIKVIPPFTNNIENLINDLQEQSTLNRLQNIISNNPNESYANLLGILTPLLDKHFPSKYVRFNKYKHKKSKWITSSIMKSISFRDKLYIKLKSTPVSSNDFSNLQTNFRTYSNILRRTIRAAKKSYYYNCFQKYKADMKKTWSTINDLICKTKNKNDFPSYFVINGAKVYNNNEIANKFNKFFTEIGPKLANNIDAPPNKSFEDFLKNPVPNSFEFSQISNQEISKAIDSLQPKTSCASDRISNKLLKAMKNELIDPLTKIINQTLDTGIFPDSLKEARVTPLYKKNDMHLMDNYRPISILPSVSKVFERIIYNQIYSYFTDFKLFYKSQYGFRTRHSTEFAALELVDRILHEMDNNKLPVSIFMDLSKAFDTLDHKILLYKLNYYGFHDKSLHLLRSYLTNRRQYVEYDNVMSDYLNITCGVPQGSILGPLLFIIYINDLPSAVKLFNLIMYADDTTLFASLCNNNIHPNEITLINEDLSIVNEWLKLNKLSLNILKTKAMIFHTPQRQINYPDIYIDNIKIDFVDEFNFLGLIIDKHMKWKAHTSHISKKISKAIGVMSKLKNIIPKLAMLHIYNSLILSHLTYGLIVWGNFSKNLVKLQKKAVRTINNVKYNAHTSGLFKQDNLLKLGDMRALHDFKFCFKYIHEMIPAYFLHQLSRDVPGHEHYTRQSHQLRVPAVRHEFARHSMTYRFPQIMNSMPPNIQTKIHTHSFQGFKFYIKQYFIQSYNSICDIPSCYICQN